MSALQAANGTQLTERSVIHGLSCLSWCLPADPPWGVANAIFDKLNQLFATAALTQPQWASCSHLLEVYITSRLTGPFLANIQLPGQWGGGRTKDLDPCGFRGHVC